MYHPLPEFAPLFPSGEWWRLRLRAMIEGSSLEDSILEANRLCGLKSRLWMRFVVHDKLGNDVTLSLPVVNGASALKNYPPASWTVCPDAPKCRKIDATMATLYSGSPFFNNIYAILRLKDSAGSKAENICRQAEQSISSVLGLDNPSLIISIRSLIDDKNRMKTLRESPGFSDIDLNLSILDSLFKLGPQTIFPLLLSF